MATVMTRGLSRRRQVVYAGTLASCCKNAFLSSWLLPGIAFFWAMSVGARAGADLGFRVGPRAGLERHADADLFVGADARLSFPLSPLTINPTFDYDFDEQRTLFQVSVNALYYLPTPPSLLDPYVGVGIGVASFSYKSGVVVADEHGSRVGLNLIGGVCFDVPVIAPFVQALVSVGEIDLVTIGGGFLFGPGSGKSQWDSCGKRRPGAEVRGTPRP